jgi:mono/diheme cytochrome c family protein
MHQSSVKLPRFQLRSADVRVSVLLGDARESQSRMEGTVRNQIVRVAALTGLAVLAGGTALAQDKALIDRGAKVYADQKCSICHSIAGKGNAKGALDDVGSRLKTDEIREWIVSPAEMTKKMKAERKPPMKTFPNLPREDLDALVAYMVSLKKK